MAELNTLPMTGPGGWVSVDDSEGSIDFVTMPNTGAPAAEFVAAATAGLPNAVYGRSDLSAFGVNEISVTTAVAVGVDAGTGAVGFIEFLRANKTPKLALVWQTATNQMQLWSSEYEAVIQGTTTQAISLNQPVYVQITASNGASATVRLRLYDTDGKPIFDSGDLTFDAGEDAYDYIRIGCNHRFDTAATATVLVGETVITDGEEVTPQETLLGPLTVIVAEADTEIAGDSTNDNLNTNFGSFPVSGAGEFGSAMERVRGLRRDNLANPLSGPPVHTGRTILRARFRRYTSSTHQPHNNREYGVYLLLPEAEWEELQATGAIRKTGVPWTGECAEGDYDTTPIATALGATVPGQIIEFDVTEAVRAIVANGGTKLDTITRLVEERGITNQRTGWMWYTKEESDPTRRAVLLIESEPAGDGDAAAPPARSSLAIGLGLGQL